MSNRVGGLTRQSAKNQPALLSVALLFFQALCFPQALPTNKDSRLEPREKGTKWGYIDANGEFAIPPQFDEAGPFSEGLAAVEQNKRTGYVDSNGRFVVQPKYFDAGPFKEGFAWVVTRKPFNLFGSGEYGVPLFGRITYIDRTGREILHSFSAEGFRDFSEGLALVRPGNTAGGCRGKVGYLNTKGEWGINPQFDEARDFSEGLAAVNQGAKCHSGGKWGYIDKNGKTPIPFKYDYAGQFKNGRACVKQVGQWKVIDLGGTETPINERDCLAH